MDEDVLIPIFLFGGTAVVFVMSFYYRFRSRQERQETIRMALDKGTELSPDFLKRLGEPEPSKDRDLRRGLIWMALGIGLVLCGLAMYRIEAEVLYSCLAGAAFPFAIGGAYLIMWRYGSRKASA